MSSDNSGSPISKSLDQQQQRVYEWVKNTLQLPVFADAFLGAALLLRAKSPGYVTFVSHACRDIMNNLASTAFDVHGERVQYQELCDALALCWKIEWGNDTGIRVETAETSFIDVPLDSCKKVSDLVRTHLAGNTRSKEAAYRFFGYYMGYSQVAAIPKNFLQEWRNSSKWFMDHTHLRGGCHHDIPQSEIESHFQTLTRYLYAAATSHIERLTALKNDLERPTAESLAALKSLRSMTDRQYFFWNLKNPEWLQPLRDAGWFDFPPDIEKSDANDVDYPDWPELYFLNTVAKCKSGEVVDIILNFKPSKNVRVYEGILKIATEVPAEHSQRLLPKILEYLDLGRIHGHFFPEILNGWISAGFVESALDLSRHLLALKDDPEEEAKRIRFEQDPFDITAQLEPRPRFDEDTYIRLLEDSIIPLALKAPLRATLLLSRIVKKMLESSLLDKRTDQDYSEIWCPRFTKDSIHYERFKAALVVALVKTCEIVYEIDDGNISNLDTDLRKSKWRVFKRIRQHLYAKYPSELTLPWIREFVITHSDYERYEYHHEFQIMLNKSIQFFGYSLLTQEEVDRIADRIISGPSSEGNENAAFTSENEHAVSNDGRRNYFHHLQLAPFEPLLSKWHRNYYHKLASREDSTIITDETYMPYRMQFGNVSFQSPVTLSQLKLMHDDEILELINTWETPPKSHDEPYVEINMVTLSRTYQSLLEDLILRDEQRRRFWLERYMDISRPLYTAALIKALRQKVSNGDFELLSESFELCNWVLKQHESMDLKQQSSDESAVAPDWYSSRRAVVDLIETLIRDSNLCITHRIAIWRILSSLITGSDQRLESQEELFTKDCHTLKSASYNYVRAIALRLLIHYCYWVRKHDASAPLKEVIETLDERICHRRPLLTVPEYAVLGQELLYLVYLFPDWTAKNKGKIIPSTVGDNWRAAIIGLLTCRLSPPLLALIRTDLKCALKHFDLFENIETFDGDLVDTLAMFLFFVSLDESQNGPEKELLTSYYKQTIGNQKRWAKLLSLVGKYLSTITETPNQSEIAKFKAFFEWRYAEQNPIELAGFIDWVEAEGLEVVWRLERLSRVLDLCEDAEFKHRCIVPLNNLAALHLPLVVECFRKLTQKSNHDRDLYLLQDQAVPILERGLVSSIEAVKKDAIAALNNLLGADRFDLLYLAELIEDDRLI